MVDKKITIYNIGLSVRAINCLTRAGIRTVDDILFLTSAEEILKIRNIGKRTSGEIAHKLNSLGFGGSAWDYFLPYWVSPTGTDEMCGWG